MTSNELITSLQSKGYRCSIDNDFDLLEDLTFLHERLICATPSAIKSGTILPYGISFWIHQGGGLNFLGLWSGHLFCIESPENLESLALEVLAGTHHDPHRAPWNLPDDILVKFDAKRCEPVLLCNSIEDSLEIARSSAPSFPYSKDEFLSLVAPSVDVCQCKSEGFVWLTRGTAQAVTRFTEEGTVRDRFLCLLFLGDFEKSRECLDLLQALGSRFKCAFYDTAWDNKISFDDPYYSPNETPRPDSPRRKWAGE